MSPHFDSLPRSCFKERAEYPDTTAMVCGTEDRLTIVQFATGNITCTVIYCIIS